MLDSGLSRPQADTPLWVCVYLSPSHGLLPSAKFRTLLKACAIAAVSWGSGMSLLGVGLGKRAWAVITATLLLAPALAADGAIIPSSEVAVFALSNDASALPERTVSFGQIFRPGTVSKQDQLQAVIGGVPAPTQIDAKAFNSDGSIRHAIVSVQLPRLSGGQRLIGTLVSGAQTTTVAGEFASIPQVDVIVTLKTQNAPDKPV